jgi:TusA-related sulfurtransferase
MREIDARGLACPAPVLQTKAVLQEEISNSVKVIVDNAAAQQNVQRFFESQGFQTALESRGVKILVCGTCLNHFNLLERKQVGETTNMLDIVTAMQLADKVINI